MSPDVGFGLAGGFAALMFVLVPVLMLGIIGFGIYAAIKGYQQAKLRRAAIAALVAAKGWRLVAEDPSRTEIFTSAPFGIGDNRRARARVWGAVDGKVFETFAYSYETHSTDSDGKRSTTHHHYQVTWVPMPGPLPTMRFTRDNALLRGLANLGAKDLNVESHAFNQRWKVWCADERAGHAILTPRMIERFLAPDLAGLSLVIEGTGLMIYSQGHSDLSELPGVVSLLHEIKGLIPQFVWGASGAADAG